MKKVIILADLHDLIQFQDVDRMLLQQLYVVVFIFRHYHHQLLIHINNNSDIDFSRLWKADSPLANYLDNCIIQKSWTDINFKEYNYVLCFHHFQHTIKDFLPDSPNTFTFINPKGLRENYVLSRVDTLFRPGGEMPLEQAFIEGPLSRFKTEIKNAFTGFDRQQQELLYADTLQGMIAVNAAATKSAYQRILILDDYKHNFYIGDSTFWFRTIRKAILAGKSAGMTTINCNNKKVLTWLNTLYGPTLPANATFSGMPWERINFRDYDLILFETDLMAKLLHHLQHHYPEGLPGSSFYTITPFIHSTENKIRYLFNIDFFATHPHPYIPHEDSKMASTNEIVITKDERSWAQEWLQKHHVRQSDQVIVVLNGSSVDQKVVQFDVFLRFIQWLITTDNTKVLLFDENGTGIKHEIYSSISDSERDRIIVAENQSIRKDLALLTSEHTVAIVGPCTGMFHLANGIYIHLLNTGALSSQQVPLMLVYTGRQHFHDEYNPRVWWSDSLVDCAILTRQHSGLPGFISLPECPQQCEEFKAISVSPREITSDLLKNAFLSAFPSGMKKKMTG